MGNPERQQHNTQIQKIPCESADIGLVAPEKWTLAFEQHPERRRIYTSSGDTLPHPLSTTAIEHWFDREDDLHNLSATMTFSPEDIEDETPFAWQEPIMEKLEERLGKRFETHVLEHEKYTALCVELTPDYFAHVHTITDINECIVTMDVQRMNELDFALKRSREIPEDAEATEPYVVFKDLLEVWSATIDSVVEVYGKPKRGKHTDLDTPQIILMPPTTSKEVAVIESPAIPEREDINPNITTFSNIAGYDDVKEKLKSLALLHTHPDIAEDIGLESNHGILLYGPPGTGKTTLLKAFANEIDATLMQLSVSEIIDKWVGSSARNIDNYFNELLSQEGKIILLMDEFDAIGVNGHHSSSGERNDTVNRLKEYIVDINENHPNIILTGATNYIERVDPALIRPGRLMPIEVHPPTERMRRDIWALMLGQVAAKAADIRVERPGAALLDIAEDIDVHALAEKTNGMVGAHFKEILNAIRRARLREYTQTGKIRPIAQDDLLHEITNIDLEP